MIFMSRIEIGFLNILENSLKFAETLTVDNKNYRFLKDAYE